jgi:hypothetical protein
MAITAFHVEKLMEARRRGVSFRETVTLGRLHWLVPEEASSALAKKFGISPKPDADLRPGGFADTFFRDWLGVEALTSMDASSFEGAKLIYDLNYPLPESLHRQFDAVLDGGTLEHVFNFPVAIKSCLAMVKTGGFFFWTGPANNYCGHGFYQFSPELAFRILAPENGFEIQEIEIMTHPFPGGELSPRKTLYSVKDPAQVESRVCFMGNLPAVMVLQAKRISTAPIFESFPQQSDYARAWKGDPYVAKAFGSEKGSYLGVLAIWLSNRLPIRLRNWLAGMYQRYFLCTLRNRKLFRKL